VIILRARSYLSFRDTIAGGQDSVALPIHFLISRKGRKRASESHQRPSSSPLCQSSPVRESDSRSKQAAPAIPASRMLMRNAARSHNAGGANPAGGYHRATCSDRLCTSASRATSAASGVGTATPTTVSESCSEPAPVRGKCLEFLSLTAFCGKLRGEAQTVPEFNPPLSKSATFPCGKRSSTTS
jgi:hypothetical protein